jgi:hypothetical protein
MLARPFVSLVFLFVPIATATAGVSPREDAASAAGFLRPVAGQRVCARLRFVLLNLFQEEETIHYNLLIHIFDTYFCFRFI